MGKEVYDIGMICMMNHNIGNCLTNYALYQYIRDMGYSVLVIGVPNDAPIAYDYKEKNILYDFFDMPYDKNDLLYLENKWEMYEKTELCDMYLVASDQLWRAMFLEGSNYFTTLDWLHSYKYKISYATSMGVGCYEGEVGDDAKVGHRLNRINAISVREESGRRYLKDRWNIDSKTVLDPVFLCDSNYYNKMAAKGQNRKKSGIYVGVYLLDICEEKERFVEKIARQYFGGNYMAMTEPIISEINNVMLSYTLNPKVEEWLAMIEGSDMVITDSFHGLCFALIYEKPFFVIYDRANWRGVDRFDCLLNALGLEDRLIDYSSDFNIKDCNINIDYMIVREQLKKYRLDSSEWLINAILHRKDYCPIYNEYDDYLRLRYEYTLSEDKRKKMYSKMMCDRAIQYLQGLQLRRINRKIEKDGKQMNVIGWGAGNCFRDNINRVIQYIDIRYVCDNNPNMWGKELENHIICISPAEIMKMNNVVVLIMLYDAHTAISVANQLLDMGICSYDHVLNWLKEIEQE